MQISLINFSAPILRSHQQRYFAPFVMKNSILTGDQVYFSGKPQEEKRKKHFISVGLNSEASHISGSVVPPINPERVYYEYVYIHLDKEDRRLMLTPLSKVEEDNLKIILDDKNKISQQSINKIASIIGKELFHRYHGSPSLYMRCVTDPSGELAEKTKLKLESFKNLAKILELLIFYGADIDILFPILEAPIAETRTHFSTNRDMKTRRTDIDRRLKQINAQAVESYFKALLAVQDRLVLTAKRRRENKATDLGRTYSSQPEREQISIWSQIMDWLDPPPENDVPSIDPVVIKTLFESIKNKSDLEKSIVPRKRKRESFES